MTEEDGAPQVALITQDGTQQVEALGMGAPEVLGLTSTQEPVLNFWTLESCI